MLPACINQKDILSQRHQVRQLGDHLLPGRDGAQIALHLLLQQQRRDILHEGLVAGNHQWAGVAQQHVLCHGTHGLLQLDQIVRRRREVRLHGQYEEGLPALVGPHSDQCRKEVKLAGIPVGTQHGPTADRRVQQLQHRLAAQLLNVVWGNVLAFKVSAFSHNKKYRKYTS